MGKNYSSGFVIMHTLSARAIRNLLAFLDVFPSCSHMFSLSFQGLLKRRKNATYMQPIIKAFSGTRNKISPAFLSNLNKTDTVAPPTKAMNLIPLSLFLQTEATISTYGYATWIASYIKSFLLNIILEMPSS